MSSPFARAVRLLRSGGPVAVGGRIGRGLYLRTRPLLPDTRVARYNGVEVGINVKAVDRLVPAAWRAPFADRPLYESALVGGILRCVRAGDRVVVVGGGWGVTTTHAARQAGEAGVVDAYEASDEMVARSRDTLARGGVAGRVRLHHAIVAAGLSVWGDSTAAVVPPSELPPCDVLVMDCEGAERAILAAMPGRPRVILVETHGVFDAHTVAVRGDLEAAGYEVVADEIAEEDQRAYCEAHDIRVLTAVQRPAAPSPPAA